MGKAAKRAPRASSAAAKAAAKKAAAAASSRGPLEDKAQQPEDGLDDRKRRRVLGRNHSEEYIEKAMGTYFGHMSQVQRETMEVDGKTLRARMREDLHTAREKNPDATLSNVYMRGLVGLYAEAAKGVNSLVVKDKSLKISDALCEALDASTRSNPATRSIEPLQGWLQSVGTQNQKEFVGVMRCTLQNHLISRASQDLLVIEQMKLLVRCNLAEARKDEIKALHNYFDEALTRQYCRLKKAGVSVAVWVQSHFALASLVLNPDDLKAIQAAGSNFSQVAPQLSRVQASSALGQALYSWAGAVVSSEQYAAEVEDSLHDVFQSSETAAHAENLRADLKVKATHYEKNGSLAKKRNVTLQFCGLHLKVTVQNPSLEVDYRYWCKIKELSLGYKDGLDFLCYEKWLFASHADTKTVVPETLLGGMRAARQVAMDMLADSKLVCFGDIKRLLLSQSNELMSLDASFKVELLYLQTRAEEDLERAIEVKLLGALPSENRRREMAESVTAISTLRSSDLGQMCSHAAQGKMEAVNEVVMNLQRGVSPSSDAMSKGDFYPMVLDRLAYFCKATVANDGGEARTLCGKPALQHLLEQMKLRFADTNDSPRLSDLEIFQSFKFLMGEADVNMLSDWVRKCLASAALGDGALAGAGGAASSSSSTPSKPSARPAIYSYFD